MSSLGGALSRPGSVGGVAGESSARALPPEVSHTGTVKYEKRSPLSCVVVHSDKKARLLRKPGFFVVQSVIGLVGLSQALVLCSRIMSVKRWNR